ncbi:hypothetical protein B0A48_00367 [Cryoendolithus antarcticus]|uniref:Uncharacterized protein n=1 Tax=Cryoendolithus antarcticus TaxID=1507870 RepID=A0A1V8TUA7_9PEZI|nr:hypothetical protein B0A48_00367 [Cryoendolithus antarcticus]
MAPTNATSQTLTIRLKLHKTTILLHTEPTSKLSTLPVRLLATLHDTHASGKLGSYTIPNDPEDVLLANLRDPNDASLGWEEIGQSTRMANGNGKAKAQKSSKSQANGVGQTVADAGIRDGIMLAFRFRTAAEKQAADAEDDEDVDVDEIATKCTKADAAEAKWDVILPDLEDENVARHFARLGEEDDEGYEGGNGDADEFGSQGGDTVVAEDYVTTP